MRKNTINIKINRIIAAIVPKRTPKVVGTVSSGSFGGLSTTEINIENSLTLIKTRLFRHRVGLGGRWAFFARGP